MIRNLALPALLLALLPAPALRAQDNDGTKNDPIPLPHEDSDIATDSAVTWGLLDNGMRYAILPNQEPPNRVSMRLYVDAGSLMENDDQQGLAHFLEHMAFNGTENFPAGEMVEYFQRLGMGFGNHTNAHTSFNETVYKLELPTAETDMIDEGMKLLRDYADGMLLLPDEIDDERGVILSEKRSRDSVSWRTFVEQLKFLLPGHRVSKRLPIGEEEVIRDAPRERFVEFYENWYTPNRMAVIVVGDIEVEPVEKILKSYFADMPAREKRPDPDLGAITKRELSAHYHYEEEAGETSVSIEAFLPRVNPPDNKARRKHDLELMLAGSMMNRRLERIAKQEDTPINSASLTATDLYDLNFTLYSSIDADCKPENWPEAVALIERELRRGLEHGFTEAEMNEAKAQVRQHFETSAKQMATRKSRDLANQIASRLGARRIFTNPADDLPRVTEALDSISADSCHETLANLWSTANETLLLLSGNAKIEGDAAAKLIATYRESGKTGVEPPVETELRSFAYSDLPGPGEIAEKKETEDLGVTQLRFANNVRANFKVTDFEDDTIYVKARIGGGLLTEKTPGLSFFVSSIFDSGGLEAHSEDELKQLFAGESISVGFSVDDDAFSLGGQTTPEDLGVQLELMRAYITHPGLREDAAIEFRRGLDGIYQQLERTPGGFLNNEVDRYLHSGDKRFGYPDRKTLETFTVEQARDWVVPHLQEGYLELSLVGDFDLEKAIASVAATFGNLPERASEKPAFAEERAVAFPGGAAKSFEFESEIPKGIAAIYWPTEDIFDIGRSRRLGMLGAILDDRLRVKIREELGDAYSPFAHNIPSDTWKDYGYLFAMVTVDPDQASSVNEVITDIARDLSGGDSITEDELERAKKPQVTSIEEMRRTNRYWLGSVLEASQEYPQRLDWSRTFVDDYRNITVDEVNALAKEYLSEEAQVSVVVIPKEKQDGEKKSE